MIGKIRKSIVLIMMVVFFSYTIIAQTTVISTAVPFLLISSSPESNGQGATSVSRQTDDPFVVNYNPAHLGGMQNNLSISFYPTKTNWLPGLGLKNLTYNSYVFCGGTNLKEYLSVPLSIGVAYSRVDLNLGTFNRTSATGPDVIGTFNGEEHNDAFSLDVGWDIGIKLAMGISFRRIESNLAPMGAGQEQGSGSASAWSRDYGFLLDIPVIELAANEATLANNIKPICNISFGSALTNIGGKMTYIKHRPIRFLVTSL